MFTILIILAPQLVLIMMGEKWMQMVVPLQILCITGMLQSIGTHVGSVLLSKGRSDIHIKCDILMMIILPTFVLIGIQHGIIGVSLAVTTTSLLLFLVIQKIVNKIIDLSFFDFFKALYPATISSFVLILAMLLFQKLNALILLSHAVYLVCLGVVGIMFYMFAIWKTDKKSIKEIIELTKQLKVK